MLATIILRASAALWRCEPLAVMADSYFLSAFSNVTTSRFMHWSPL